MSSMTAFERRTRLAYELGRFKMSVRVSRWIVPMAALAIYDARRSPYVWTLAVALLVLAIAMRWQSRAGVDAVTSGLQTGAPALLVGFGLCRIGCPAFSALSIYGGMCVAFGAICGIWIVLKARSAAQYTPGNWATTVGVATLLAGVGCTSLGLGNVLGIAIGIVVSSSTIFVLAPAASR